MGESPLICRIESEEVKGMYQVYVEFDDTKQSILLINKFLENYLFASSAEKIKSFSEECLTMD